MWHSGGVWWVGLEADGKDIVRILAGNMQVFGASLVVLEMQCGQLQLWDLLDALESKAMELLADIRKVGDIGNGGISTSRQSGQSVRGYCGISRALKLPTDGTQHVWSRGWMTECRAASEMSEEPALDDACRADWPREAIPKEISPQNY
jgi:hypothetical protein